MAAAQAADRVGAPPGTTTKSTMKEADDPNLPPRASAEDCRLWRIEYRASHACYGRFRTANGGIKPEAFSVCGPEVLDPAVECGPQSYQ